LAVADIRRIAQRDIDAVARLCAMSAAEDGERYCAMDADHLRLHAFGPHPMFETWIAEAPIPGRPNLQPVGHAIATRGYDVRHAVATLVLAQLYVIPEVRRDGVARQLIAAVSFRAMELGARELMITTGVENAVARRFFSAVGAKEQTMAVYVMESDEVEWLAAEAR
jgi:GNAT superfamily N-acetyltransferase